MPIRTAIVPTENGSSYLRKLCQHWSHKFTVTYTAEHGTIELPETVCTLDATPTHLSVHLSMQEGVDVARIQSVVAEHLQRFGFKETLEFPWKEETS